jgi:hypothetical protein
MPAPLSAGLAEPAKTFLPGPVEQAGQQAPRLRPIEGGGGDDERGGGRQRRARAHLRLVKK